MANPDPERITRYRAAQLAAATKRPSRAERKRERERKAKVAARNARNYQERKARADYMRTTHNWIGPIFDPTCYIGDMKWKGISLSSPDVPFADVGIPTAVDPAFLTSGLQRGFPKRISGTCPPPAS